MGLATEVPEGACFYGKGISIVPHGIAEEKRNLEVGEIAWKETADRIYLSDVIDIYSLVLQAAGEGPMIFDYQGQLGACAKRKADGIPRKMFGSAENVELEGDALMFGSGRQRELVWAF